MFTALASIALAALPVCGPLDLETVLSLAAVRSDEVAIRRAEYDAARTDVALAAALRIIPEANATLIVGPSPSARGNVVQPIYTWGRLDAASDAAKAGTQARSFLVDDQLARVHSGGSPEPQGIRPGIPADAVPEAGDLMIRAESNRSDLKALLEALVAQEAKIWAEEARATLSAGRSWFRAAGLDFSAGLSEPKDLIDAYAAYVETQVWNAQATYDLLLARARLALVTGELPRKGEPTCDLR